MKYGNTHGVLKPLDQVMLPDSRFEPLSFISSTRERPLALADLHKRLSACPIGPAVPVKVRVLFETAKNLMLYTWFVLEFQTVAEMQAYAALEMGLRERLGNPMREIITKRGRKERPLMLSEMLSKVVNEGLILPEKLPSWDWAKRRKEWFANQEGIQPQPLSAMEWLEGIKNDLPDARNTLAHGSSKLWLTNSFSQLELCGDLINALFPTN